MKKLIEPLLNKNGTGLLLLMIFLSGIAVMFLILVVNINLIYINQSVASTRADAIADSVAVYALRYDNSISRGDALRMTALLAAHNTSEGRPISVMPEINGNRLIITTEVEGKYIPARYTFTSYGKSIVDTVEPGTGGMPWSS